MIVYLSGTQAGDLSVSLFVKEILGSAWQIVMN